jgi:Asp-tRNA(Asn)/Glu-tRNA(Gln) amidotransferase B subunit
MNAKGLRDIRDLESMPRSLAGLVGLVAEGRLSGLMAKDVLEQDGGNR